jgi:hypothetical protein
MSTDSERDLVALIANEQRGFKTMLFAGVAVLVVLVLMSAALGVYYYQVSQTLSETSRELQLQAFNARRSIDAQNNQASDQARRLRRVSYEIRNADERAPVPVNADTVLAAARGYLQGGQLSIDDEWLLDAGNDAQLGEQPMRDLLRGISALLAWERNGDTLDPNAALPRRFVRGREAFEAARADPALAPLASAGLAAFIYIEAQASNYAAQHCDALFATVDASAENGAIGAQPLWQRAQCERKLGRTADAMGHYAQALEATYRNAQQRGGRRQDTSELMLAMNAYHGLGTTLTALHDTPEADAAKASALDVARRACVPEEGMPAFELLAQAPDLQLAESCLRAALALRDRLRQTQNQVSGTRENLGFLYMREHNFQAAYDNARAVERTGLFAWNEMLRALSAEQLEDPAAASAGEIARRHVGFFGIGQFSVCELQALMDAAHYEQAIALIQGEHPGETVACEAPATATVTGATQ